MGAHTGATEPDSAALERLIFRLRGRRVMLDADLAHLYGVTTAALNQAVSRNRARFPPDFMFRLTREETKCLRSQIVISNGRGGRRTKPRAFTEHGIAMLSSVLRSPHAIRVNIEIMRAFARLREFLASHAELANRLDQLETRVDGQFSLVFQSLRALAEPPTSARRKRRIGFGRWRADEGLAKGWRPLEKNRALRRRT